MKEFNFHNLNLCRKSACFKYLGIVVRESTDPGARPWAHVPALKADARGHGYCLNGDFPSHSGNQRTINFCSGSIPSIILFSLIILVLEYKIITLQRSLIQTIDFCISFLSFFQKTKQEREMFPSEWYYPSHDIFDLFFTEDPIRVP